MQVDISCRKTLADALKNPDAAIRTRVLQAINQKIDQALAAGKSLNPEVVEELYCRYETLQGCFDATWFAFLLLRLNDSRSATVAKREFVSTDNNEILLLAAAHVARLPAAEKIDLLTPLVMAADNSARSRAAANLLDDCMADLQPPVALRAALISDHDLTLPPVNAETLSDWCHELKGPYPLAAQEALLQAGEKAIAAMLSLWDRLPEDIRIWILCTGAEKQVPGTAEKIRDIIGHENDGSLLRIAIECLKAMDMADENLLATLYAHHSPAIRAAAVSAGSAPLDWSSALRRETADEVRLAIVSRIERCGGEANVAPLVELLADKNWRIRARATDALVALAPASLAPLQKSLESAREWVRVAAAQGLSRLGTDESNQHG